MKEILGFELSELPMVVKNKKDDNEQFIKFIKGKKRCNLDGLAHTLHEEAYEKFDCLTCGNCCKTIGPRLHTRDVVVMAKTQRMKTDQFMAEYIRRDTDGDLVFKTMPCRFLDEDNHCLIYDDRPKACADYPHTDHKKFVQLLSLTLKNASYCPIAFYVIEGLKSRFDYRTKQRQ